MRNFSLLKDCKWTKVESTASAGTSTLTTDILDMSGYDSVMFLASLGTIVDAAVPELSLKGNTANSTSSPTPVELVDATFTASTSSGISLACECHVPSTYRYVFCDLVRATQNVTVDCIWAIQFNAREVPITQSSSANGMVSAIGYPTE